MAYLSLLLQEVKTVDCLHMLHICAHTYVLYVGMYVLHILHVISMKKCKKYFHIIYLPFSFEKTEQKKTHLWNVLACMGINPTMDDGESSPRQ